MPASGGVSAPAAVAAASYGQVDQAAAAQAAAAYAAYYGYGVAPHAWGASTGTVADGHAGAAPPYPVAHAPAAPAAAPFNQAHPPARGAPDAAPPDMDSFPLLSLEAVPRVATHWLERALAEVGAMVRDDVAKGTESTLLRYMLKQQQSVYTELQRRDAAARVEALISGLPPPPPRAALPSDIAALILAEARGQPLIKAEPAPAPSSPRPSSSRLGRRGSSSGGGGGGLPPRAGPNVRLKPRVGSAGLSKKPSWLQPDDGSETAVAEHRERLGSGDGSATARSQASTASDAVRMPVPSSLASAPRSSVASSSSGESSSGDDSVQRQTRRRKDRKKPDVPNRRPLYEKTKMSYEFSSNFVVATTGKKKKKWGKSAKEKEREEAARAAKKKEQEREARRKRLEARERERRAREEKARKRAERRAARYAREAAEEEAEEAAEAAEYEAGLKRRREMEAAGATRGSAGDKETAAAPAADTTSAGEPGSTTAVQAGSAADASPDRPSTAAHKPPMSPIATSRPRSSGRGAGASEAKGDEGADASGDASADGVALAGPGVNMDHGNSAMVDEIDDTEEGAAILDRDSDYVASDSGDDSDDDDAAPWDVGGGVNALDSLSHASHTTNEDEEGEDDGGTASVGASAEDADTDDAAGESGAESLAFRAGAAGDTTPRDGHQHARVIPASPLVSPSKPPRQPRVLDAPEASPPPRRSPAARVRAEAAEAAAAPMIPPSFDDVASSDDGTEAKAASPVPPELKEAGGEPASASSSPAASRARSPGARRAMGGERGTAATDDATEGVHDATRVAHNATGIDYDATHDAKRVEHDATGVVHDDAGAAHAGAGTHAAAPVSPPVAHVVAPRDSPTASDTRSSVAAPPREASAADGSTPREDAVDATAAHSRASDAAHASPQSYTERSAAAPPQQLSEAELAPAYRVEDDPSYSFEANLADFIRRNPAVPVGKTPAAAGDDGDEEEKAASALRAPPRVRRPGIPRSRREPKAPTGKYLAYFSDFREIFTAYHTNQHVSRYGGIQHSNLSGVGPDPATWQGIEVSTRTIATQYATFVSLLRETGKPFVRERTSEAYFKALKRSKALRAAAQASASDEDSDPDDGHHEDPRDLRSEYFQKGVGVTGDGALRTAEGKPHRYYKVMQNRMEVYQLVTEVLDGIGGYQELPPGVDLKHSWDLLWSWSRPKIQYNTLLVWQRVNHFPHNKELTRKDLLKKNLARYTCVGGRLAKAFELLPPTFVLPKEYIAFTEAFARGAAANRKLEQQKAMEAGGLMDEDVGEAGLHSSVQSSSVLAAALMAGKNLSRSTSVKDAGPNVWIMKPVGSSRGRGIRLIKDIGSVTYGDRVVIQKYVANPMLLDGYKFDLRIYVLVTSFNPLEAFIYRSGFARLSSQPYTNDISKITNKMMHLTNSSIQKYASTKLSAVAAAKGAGGGTKVTLDYLWKRLREDQGIDTDKLWEDIIDVVVKSLVCVDDVIPYQPNSFELFGYDVLIDDQLRPWLIEANASPSLGRDSPMDNKIKLSVVTDTVNIVDPLPFDREALVRVVERRMEEMRQRDRVGATGRSPKPRPSPAEQLEEDLQAVLRGAVPRRYGEMPKRLGKFRRICPGSAQFERAMKLKRAHFRSHRDRPVFPVASSTSTGVGAGQV